MSDKKIFFNMNKSPPDMLESINKQIDFLITDANQAKCAYCGKIINNLGDESELCKRITE